MVIKKQIALDFGRNTIPITVFAKQFDKDSRVIEIVPLSNGQPLTLAEGTTAKLKLTKADGKAVISSCKISDGKISVELSEQCLTASGTARAEIALYKENKILSSQVFYINVKKSAFDEAEAIESNNDFKDISTQISELKSKIESTDSLITYLRKKPITYESEADVLNIFGEENNKGEIFYPSIDFNLNSGALKFIFAITMYKLDTNNMGPDKEINTLEEIADPIINPTIPLDLIKDENGTPQGFSIKKGVEISKSYIIDSNDELIDLDFLQYCAGIFKSYSMSYKADIDKNYNATVQTVCEVVFDSATAQTQGDATTIVVAELLKNCKGMVLHYKEIANVKTAEVLL